MDISTLENKEGFDYSIAVQPKAGTNVNQDFIFHIYKNNAGKVFVGADDNSGHDNPYSGGATTEVSNIGNIIKLKHDFNVNENGEIICTMSIYDVSNNKEVFKKDVKYTSSDDSNEIVGSGYGWFCALGRNDESETAIAQTYLIEGIKVLESKLSYKNEPVKTPVTVGTATLVSPTEIIIESKQDNLKFSIAGNEVEATDNGDDYTFKLKNPIEAGKDVNVVVSADGYISKTITIKII